MSAGPWEAGSRPAIDLSLDLRREVCPHPVMLTLKQLGEMEQGQVLQVITDCASALVNIPAEVDRHGHALLGDPVRRGADTIMLIRCSCLPANGLRQKAASGTSASAGLKLRPV